jgi:flagellar hook-length control protein FliK
MLSIAPSSTVPAKLGHLPSNASALNGKQAQGSLGSFGEVLSRSLAPSGEIAEHVGEKGAERTPARRQPGTQKAAPADLVNAMGLAPIQIESKVVTVVPRGGVATPPLVNRVSGAATAPLDSPLAGTPAPVPTDEPAASGEVSPGAPSVQEQTRMVASQSDPRQATPHDKLNAVNESRGLQPSHGDISFQSKAPDTRAYDQSSKRDDTPDRRPGDMTLVSADLISPPIASTTKVDAASATPNTDSAAITIDDSPPVNPLSANAGISINSVNAAAASTAGVSAADAPTLAPVPSLSPEVGSSEWGKALGQQVIQMGKAGHQVAELQLNPPGLGPLKVTLSMDDHQIQAMFVSAHSSVRAAVEAALPQLRTSLAESGISLGSTSVSSESQQQAAFADNPNGQPTPRGYRSGRIAEPGDLSRPVAEQRRQSDAITVDTYV